MMTLNRCKCGIPPELVTMSSGLLRIACVTGKCSELVCAKPDEAERAWNEANSTGDEPTLPENPKPMGYAHVAGPEPVRQ